MKKLEQGKDKKDIAEHQEGAREKEGGRKKRKPGNKTKPASESGPSREGSTLFLGPRHPTYHFLAATRTW